MSDDDLTQRIEQQLQIEASDKVTVQSVVPEPKLTPAITAAVCHIYFIVVGAGIFYCYNSCFTALYYFEWPKFKTANPPLYMVCRTRNQNKKEMTGKR